MSRTIFQTSGECEWASVAAITRAPPRLTPVAPSDLHGCWDFVRRGLDILVTQQADTWLPEDVYAMLRGGQMTVFLAARGEALEGFVLAMRQAGWAGDVLYWWAAWAEPGLPDICPTYWAELKRIALSAGCSRMAFASNRRGWEKVAPRYGFRKRRTIYECEL